MKRLYLVGIGPGDKSFFTTQAMRALEEAEVLCGYSGYLELIQDVFPEKERITTPMTREIERCRLALQSAQSGKTTAMICSGDAGVYGMAGPCFQLLSEYKGVEIEVVPGVTAALSGAAVLGAPLMNDFAVISLSDLLTPKEVIEKRLRAVAKADFVICLYNPSSKKRLDYLRRACDILLESRSPKTVCGWVRRIGRNGQESRILSLEQLREETVDMFTTVFVGNCTTQEQNGKMVTSRGYETKERL